MVCIGQLWFRIKGKMWGAPTKILPKWPVLLFYLHSLLLWASSAGRCLPVIGVLVTCECQAPEQELCQNLGPNAIFWDGNARPQRARIFREFPQNLGVESMEWPALSPDLNPMILI